MKKVGLAVILLILLVAGAQAYLVTIDAPVTVQAGAPLVVTGTTTFPVGTLIDIVIYPTEFAVPSEIARKTVVVDETKSFMVTFPTTDLQAGQYKVEAQLAPDLTSSLGSGSVLWKLVQVVDRSKEIVLTVPKDQDLHNALMIEGHLVDSGVTTLTLDVTGPKDFAIPPVNIRTTTQMGQKDGYFSTKINVSDPGNYYVSFYDPKGFMATIKFSVFEPQMTTPSTEATTVAPETSAGTTSIPLGGLVALAAIGAACAVFLVKRR
ncbi:hypothetical protein J2741_002203 [Methanolinea mesophila]|uniref:hypothetical protein n=1 Tax=Methanolinea mesophila TaxID=547055 RepID=UPI001AE72B87|nr:hypothetical protein [Methanolinea mesophila]MBP1929656.1 hypothetical protein [Methanolinea mesophila]